MRINSSTYLAGLGLRGMAGNIRSFAFVISAAPCTLFAETANLRVTGIAVMRVGYDAARSAHSRVTNSLSSFEGLRPNLDGPLSHDSTTTTTFTYFEEEGIDGGIHFCHVIDGQKLSGGEICIALVFDSMREVGPVGRVVPGKDAVEVSSDCQQLAVIAKRTGAAGVADVGGVM
jgi:hypothetical protein